MSALAGQRAIVTGGAAGLGRAIVTRFVADGARVCVFDRNADALAELAGMFGDAVLTVAGDVRSLADNRRAVDATVERWGGLDAFVGNAGIWDFKVALVDLPDDRIDAAFDEIFAINVKGYLLGAKAAAPALVRSRGTIVFTLSNAAFWPAGGGPLYTAAKHAGVGLVRQLAYELAPFVRVNAVAPGLIPTGLRGAASLGQADTSLGSVAPAAGAPSPSSPLGVVPGIDDYVSAFIYLVSRDASTVSGTILDATGGLAARGLRDANGGAGLDARFGAG